MMQPDMSPRMVHRPAQIDEGMVIAPMDPRSPETHELLMAAVNEKVLGKKLRKEEHKFTIGIFWENELVGFSLQRRDADKRWNLRVVYLKESVRETDLLGEFLRRWFSDKTARALVKEGNSALAAALVSAGFVATGDVLKGAKSVEHLYLKDTANAYNFQVPANYRALLSPEMGGYTQEELDALSVDPDAFEPDNGLNIVAKSDWVQGVDTPSA